MRKLIKFICLLLCTIVATTSMVACGGGGGEQVDDTKTQLYVSNYDGGFGDEWLYSAKAKFEKLYENKSFEDGKTGVQIWINPSELNGPALIDSVLGAREQVFIAQSVYYYDYLSSGVMLDISDVVTESLSEFGEQKTIESKLLKEQKDFLKVGGKYYAVPHYFGANGIIYDVDLFDACKAFIGADGRFGKKSTDTGLSVGGDGVPGTPDDGLPATYEEFYKLCDRIVNYTYTPIAWSGEHQFNMGYTTIAIAAEANGANNTKLLYNFNGTSDRVIKSVSSTGNITYETAPYTIDDANGYKAYAQAGNYYALEFVKKLVTTEGYTHANNFTDGVTAQATQEEFVLSSKDSSKTPIAMLVEGNWWENEVSGFMQTMQDSGRYESAGRMERRFGFMPLPKPNQTFVGENHTLLEANNSYMFIRSDIESKYEEVAKLFLKYLSTDENLREFSVLTNTPKALEYDLTADDKAQMSYFGHNLFDFKNAQTTDIVYQCSTNPIYYNNLGTFALIDMYKYGNYNFPSNAFNNSASLTAKSYYDGYVSAWQTKYASAIA